MRRCCYGPGVDGLTWGTIDCSPTPVARRHLLAPHHAGPRPVDGQGAPPTPSQPKGLDGLSTVWGGHGALQQLRVEHERQPRGVDERRRWGVRHLEVQVRRIAVAGVADAADQVACANHSLPTGAEALDKSLRPLPSELLTGIEGASSRPIRRIVLRDGGYDRGGL